MQPDLKHRTVQPRKKQPWLLFCVIGLAILIPLFALYVIHHQSKRHQINTAMQKPVTALPMPTITQTKPEFDFYQLLPQQSFSSATPMAASNLSAPPSNHTYFELQVAMVQSLHDSTRLRDQLGAMGMTTSIEKTISHNGTLWYKIIAGPYLTREAAKNDQARLNQQHISNLLLKVN